MEKYQRRRRRKKAKKKMPKIQTMNAYINKHMAKKKKRRSIYIMFWGWFLCIFKTHVSPLALTYTSNAPNTKNRNAHLQPPILDLLINTYTLSQIAFPFILTFSSLILPFKYTNKNSFRYNSNVLLMIVIKCELSQINQQAKLFVQANQYRHRY